MNDMRTFHLEIVTPDGLAYEGDAESLLVHTTEGDVEILCGHTDYIAAVGIGRARVLVNGVPRKASCSGGFLSVCKGEVRLVAVTFEFAENIDEQRALAAKARAEQAIANAKDRQEKKIAEAKLMRALNRLRVAKK